MFVKLEILLKFLMVTLGSLLLCLLSECSVIYVSPDTSFITNSTMCEGGCGVEQCPCIGFADALSLGSSLYLSGTTNITLIALPGYYIGSENNLLSVNYSVTIRSQNGSANTYFGDGESLFRRIFDVESASLTIIGFQINFATSGTLLADTTNSTIYLQDIKVRNVFGRLMEIDSSDVYLYDCDFSVCASLIFFKASNQSSITIENSVISNIVGTYLFYDTSITGSVVMMTNSTLESNNLNSAFSADIVTIENSIFRQNVFSVALLVADKASFVNCTSVDEQFTESYIHCNRSVTVRDSSFENIFCSIPSESEFQGSLVLVQSNAGDDSVSVVDNINAKNVSSNQFFNLINCFANITHFSANNLTGPAGRITHSSDGITQIFIDDFNVLNSVDASLTFTLIERNILDGRYSRVTLSNIFYSDYIGGIYPIVINNIGGIVSVDQLYLLRAERGIVSSGNVTLTNITYQEGVCPVYSPFLFTGGEISLRNCYVENLRATTAAVFYISQEAIIAAENVTLVDCTSDVETIISIQASSGLFSHLSSTGSVGENGGVFLLNTGTLELVDSQFNDNIGKLGGAIFVRFGMIIINNCFFHGNKAEYGGSLYLQEAIVQWDNITCQNSISFQDGGCLFARNLVRGTVSNSAFLNNICLGSGGGIALRNFNEIGFLGCQLDNNTALNGGGLYVSGNSYSSFRNGLIIGNHAVSSGGGIFIKEQASPEIINCTIASNHADSTGGGIKVADNSSPVLSMLEIVANSSPNEGGGISFSDSSAANLSDSLIYNNFVNSSGGGIVFSISTHGHISNVIIQGNSAKSKGGGIAFYNNCYPSLINVTLVDNIAPEGAGTSSKDAAAPNFINSTFIGNYASSTGGGAVIYDYASGSYISCLFYNNSGGVGGGIVLNDFASAHFDTCEFIQNDAQRGGGMYVSSQQQTIVDSCHFEANIASYGAALLLTDQSTLEFTNCSCINNIAENSGGCLHIEDEAIADFTGFIVKGNRAAPTGLGNGGGITSADRSLLRITQALLYNNTAPAGGGVYIEQFAIVEASLLSIIDNIAVEGGGIFSQGTLMVLDDVLFEGNSCPGFGGRGGGLAIISLDFRADHDPLCNHCVFLNNTAYRGGGAFVSIHSHIVGATPSNELTPHTVEITPIFVNSTFGSNQAGRGAGIFYEQPSAEIGTSDVTFHENLALEYGGAVFVFRDHSLTNSDAWMERANFSSNGAYYAGSNVGWSITDKYSNSFCEDCYFGPPTVDFDGYDNSDGWASPPANLIFNSPCPSSITLSGDTFDVLLTLVDKFLTPVSGHLVEDSPVNVTLETSPNCELVSASQSHRVSSVGKVSFQDLSLAGYNNQTCSLTFFISSDNSPFIGNLTCDIVFNGCDKNELISSIPGDYDTCIENISQEQHINQAIFLILLIMVLLLFICVVGCATVFYEKYLVTKPKPFVFVPTEKKEITLDEVLNDPEIKNIPWSDIYVGDRIGHGATGLVLDGHWQNGTSMLDVALKEINIGNQTSTSSNVWSMILTEIRLMCALDDPHIVQFYGITLSEQRQLYVVMELMHQGSLRDLLDKKGNNLSWRMRLKFAISATKGIAYLHQYKIIHRDIKPQNLLVNKEWKCKVADFGISTTKETLQHTVIGTPVYMAPEIFSENNYTEKVDVYAFSILLYELYTSKRPYCSLELDALPQTQLLLQICNGLRPDTTDIPSTLKQLLEDCWNHSPKLRPSCKEILVRLRRLQKLELPNTIHENLRPHSRWMSLDNDDIQSSSDDPEAWIDPDVD